MPVRDNGQQGTLSVTIKDSNALYAAYMPFVENGGLFIPGNKKYQLGDEVFMQLTLMDEAGQMAIAGKVIWVTPPGAEGNRAAGIGIQFNDNQDNGLVRDKIEGYLGDTLQSGRPTHTL